MQTYFDLLTMAQTGGDLLAAPDERRNRRRAAPCKIVAMGIRLGNVSDTLQLPDCGTNVRGMMRRVE